MPTDASPSVSITRLGGLTQIFREPRHSECTREESPIDGDVAPVLEIPREYTRDDGCLAKNVHFICRQLAYIFRLCSLYISVRISARLEGFSLKIPRSALVTITLPGFFAPRIVMQV